MIEQHQKTYYGVQIITAIMVWGTVILNKLESNLLLEKKGNVIKPRVRKTKKEQKSRVKEKAEVFTSS